MCWTTTGRPKARRLSPALKNVTIGIPSGRRWSRSGWLRRAVFFFLTGPTKSFPSRSQIARRLESQREQLILGVTESCNFRCRYCVYGSDDPSSGLIPTGPCLGGRPGRDDAFLQQSRKSESRSISFYGGEPLLNLPLIPPVRELCQRNLPRPSSQLRHDDQRLPCCGTRRGISWRSTNLPFTVSLDGPRDIHDRNRLTQGGSPTWEQVMANLRAFLSRHPQYKINGHLRFNAGRDAGGGPVPGTGVFRGSAMSSRTRWACKSAPKADRRTGNTLRARDRWAFLRREKLPEGVPGKSSIRDRHSCRSHWITGVLVPARPYLLFTTQGTFGPPICRRGLACLNTLLCPDSEEPLWTPPEITTL